MTTTLSARAAYTTAAFSGVVLWLAAAAAGGRREAWDSPLYWSAAYPLGVAVAALLGYLAPHRPWRWALALMLAQAATLAALARSFGLLPLGLIMFAFLAVPPAAVASAAAWVRRRRGDDRAEGRCARDSDRDA